MDGWTDADGAMDRWIDKQIDVQTKTTNSKDKYYLAHKYTDTYLSLQQLNLNIH